jgi:hypothetical protein
VRPETAVTALLNSTDAPTARLLLLDGRAFANEKSHEKPIYFKNEGFF